mmetsp:Transcript_26268/g.38939  ORF Transcript_26268/g.38939 Transcript_26268/m.38939 type:complete len:326 (-) Transcript_26268:177-1154(-)|eukprot:CAMPEP_0185025232 /NCGR_PEP_ID=MMETSP1103-20130426/8268_1 /TAXON_ID=36769 /ORGANISM="Paraphysomonas bandaiensis, Strain Caron Lab Isolate" /LENGTH=325 /DNA_ID=CAMNT_0027558383 /DNA_START=45 /DNA_END=1022 /DNA_ORIENTATION=-
MAGRVLCNSLARAGQKRSFASVTFQSFGNPSEVLKAGKSLEVSAPASGEVKIGIKSCPVTYEDIRSIRGLSLLRSKTGIAGTFGVGTVSAVGPDVSIPPNGQVLVVTNSGTWNDEVVASSSGVFDASSLSVEQAALLPDVASAWEILQSNASLKSGDVVIRTEHGPVAFNSAIDAICKNEGIHVIVARDSDLLDSNFKSKISSKGVARLAVSCSIGKFTRPLMSLLANDSVVVTYNGPVPPLEVCEGIDIPVTKSIFNGQRVKGFDFHALAKNDPERAARAVAAGAELLRTGALKISATVFPSSKCVEAIAMAENGQTATISVSS